MAQDRRRSTRAVAVAAGAAALSAAAAIGVARTTDTASALGAGIVAGCTALGGVVLLLGGRRAARPGGGGGGGLERQRYYWGLVATIVAALAGAALAVVEGLDAVRDPAPLDRPAWSLAALGGGLLLQVAGLRIATNAANEVRGRASWPRFVRHGSSPELPVMLLLVTVAIAATLAALAAIGAAEATADPAWDGAGALAAGALLALGALVLVGQVRSLLLGSSASRRHLEAITGAVAVDPSVIRLIDLRSQHHGPDELIVGVKVELDHTLSLPEAAEVVARIERTVRAAVPAARHLYIETDVDEARRAAPAVDEHEPGHQVPPEIQAQREAEAHRGALGAGIPVEAEPG